MLKNILQRLKLMKHQPLLDKIATTLVTEYQASFVEAIVIAEELVSDFVNNKFSRRTYAAELENGKIVNLTLSRASYYTKDQKNPKDKEQEK